MTKPPVHPLRWVIRRLGGTSRIAGFVGLSCGHEVVAASDMVGPTGSLRQRCYRCSRKLTQDFDPQPWLWKLVRFGTRKGEHVLFEGPETQAKARYTKLCPKIRKGALRLSRPDGTTYIETGLE